MILFSLRHFLKRVSIKCVPVLVFIFTAKCTKFNVVLFYLKSLAHSMYQYKFVRTGSLYCVPWLLNFFCLQTCKDTKDIGSLQKAADFVRAFTLGFEVDVSVAF